MPLGRLNSMWALAFLILSLHSQTESLYSSWATWPWFHLLYASFSFLSFVQSYLFIHVGLLPHLLHVLHLEGDHFWAWRRRSLKINQLFWTLLSLGLYLMGFFQADIWTWTTLLSWTPGLWSCLLASFPPCRDLKSTISWSPQPRLLLNLTIWPVPPCL